ncbi:mevalonate kinase [Amycolatopsis azurea DSM 43854]|uniref:mevalonate kinase n=1 Tax=Amycolatopsis azurea DSM 43854 TaxID=1238180 RepID=A0ABX3J6C4_9PSEU|nr:mevalonate kinase [Amycolatopsis azurea DSM 43854]
MLLGEHAVVYGAPAVAIPVPALPVEASAAWSGSLARQDEISLLTTAVVDTSVLTLGTDGLHRLISAFRKIAGVRETAWVDVCVDCEIPFGRGLGSSAAHARAVVLALGELFGRQLDDRAIFDLVQIAENVAHGNASGVDAAAVGSPVPILFSDRVAERLSVGFDGVVVVADSGVAGKTKDAVELLRQRFERAPESRMDFMGRSADLTYAAVKELTEGRARDFGSSLTAAHELLRGMGLSTDLIDRLVDVALDAGSLGAKITGGGLGGCAIALARGLETAGMIARRLEEAGAVRTWSAPLRRCVDDGG